MSHRNVLTVGRGPFLADWNETHIHNPAWPPHAKFHNAQTMSMGVGLAVTNIASLGFRNAKAVDPPATGSIERRRPRRQPGKPVRRRQLPRILGRPA